MAYASGYITVETEVDINDYDSAFEIEFDGITDVIETARSNGYSPEEIIDYCFDECMVDPTKFMQEYMTIEQITQLYRRAVIEKMDEQGLTISNLRDRIKELDKFALEQSGEIAELRKTDEEAVKDVAY